jgi:hypothetical protein
MFERDNIFINYIALIMPHNYCSEAPRIIVRRILLDPIDKIDISKTEPAFSII